MDNINDKGLQVALNNLAKAEAELEYWKRFVSDYKRITPSDSSATSFVTRINNIIESVPMTWPEIREQATKILQEKGTISTAADFVKEFEARGYTATKEAVSACLTQAKGKYGFDYDKVKRSWYLSQGSLLKAV